MACHWYFNPAIKEAEIYYNSLDSHTIILQLPSATNKELVTYQPATSEHKNLIELQVLSPYSFPSEGYQCTVTIVRVLKDNAWWYPACTKCSKATTPQPKGYQCFLCDWTGYVFKYKLSFLASDGTALAEMFCFDNIAKQIVGKSCDPLVRSMSPSAIIHPDVAAIVSLKFTFVVTVTEESYHTPNKVLHIKSILTAYGRQRSIPTIVENIEEHEPSTPMKSPVNMLVQDSPSMAMEKLSTYTPPKIAKSLTYTSIKPETSEPHGKDVLYDETKYKITEETESDGCKDVELSLSSPPKRFKTEQQQNLGKQSGGSKSTRSKKN